MKEIWILGATGRSGRAVARPLAAAGHQLVLVGRDAERLQDMAAGLSGQHRIVVAPSVAATAAELSRNEAAVVINTIGPFAETALPIARACPPGSGYLDLSNELSPSMDLLALHEEAVVSGCTFVTGAGFGVLGTESVVLHLCAGNPTPQSVRVDAMAVVATEPGLLGHALAATIVGVTAGGGWCYSAGKLVRAPILTGLETLTAPDGSVIKTVTSPTAELVAAQRASGALFVTAASSLVPTAPLIGALVRLAVPFFKIRAIQNFAIRRLAAVQFKAMPRSREYSWAHARVEWAGGTVRQGWLRTGDAMDFTVATMVAVATRLARGEGKTGAFTPGELFGVELAVEAGGKFFVE